MSRVNAAIEKRLPEQRLFLKSDDGTRFIRLRASTQALMMLGGAAFIGWTVIVTSVFLIDAISAGNAREQAQREQAMFQVRLNMLSDEANARRMEAAQAQDRFALAMDQVAEMQTRLLASEQRRRELETGVDVIQTTLRRTIDERDAARANAATLRTELQAETGDIHTAAAREAEMEQTIVLLSARLDATAGQRDESGDIAARASNQIERLNFEAALSSERQERVFRQLEEAVAVSMEPLDEMLSASGMSTERIIGQVRSTYDGQGGPLMPITMSTSGEGEMDPLSLRANEVLERLDEMNLYRIAAEQLPFSMPVAGNFRHTSGFGYRRDPFNGGRRLHSGTDFAGSRGTAIVAGGDGRVIFSGRQSGYGLMVEIDHGFGFTTRYAHLSRIRVQDGERVSRGERIGDMGSTGRSTGTHLHYEVRRNGTPVNPMTFITAGRDVF